MNDAMEVILHYTRPPVAMSSQVLHFSPGLADRPEFGGVAKAGAAS